jgi:hypothetical protein
VLGEAFAVTGPDGTRVYCQLAPAETQQQRQAGGPRRGQQLLSEPIGVLLAKLEAEQ